MARERATELEYLKWFKHHVDLGPAESDVIDALNERFMNETGKIFRKVGIIRATEKPL